MFDEPGVGLASIGNDFLDGLLTGLWLQVTEIALGMPENHGQKGEESLVPVRTGCRRSSTNHGTEPPRNAGVRPLQH